MKFTKKLSKFMLVIITITVLAFGLFWPQGYFYAAKYLAYASLFTLIFYLFGCFSRKEPKKKVKNQEERFTTIEDDVPEVVEAEVVNESDNKLTLVRYHFHIAGAYLDECDLTEAEKHYKKGMEILDSILEKTDEVKDLEADAISLGVRIKVDRL